MPEALNPCSRCNGSGTEPVQPRMDQIRAYMTATGWKPETPGGKVGQLWHHDDYSRSIGVMWEDDPEGTGWRSVITRLSWAEDRSEAEITADIVARAEKQDA